MADNNGNTDNEVRDLEDAEFVSHDDIDVVLYQVGRLLGAFAAPFIHGWNKSDYEFIKEHGLLRPAEGAHFTPLDDLPTEIRDALAEQMKSRETGGE